MADTNLPGSPRVRYPTSEKSGLWETLESSNPAAHQSQPRRSRRFADIQPGLNSRKTVSYEGENRGALQ